MNKVVNINLGGRIIPMNESAYEKLQAYLSVLKSYFERVEDGSEIIHDMEDRIGELLEQKIKKGAASVEDAHIEEVKTIMGSPEAIAGETEEASGNEQAETNKSTQEQEATKRLCRSRNDKVIGGVCGGLAAHLGIDPAIMRLIFALISIFWGVGILIYIILWIVLPAEQTTVTNLKKRWYRNEEKKVIAGVCGGIGSYFNIDPIWPRLVFLIPVLLGFGLGFANDYLSFSFGGFPVMILLYLILWISMPKADTLTEKLEMQGKKVDIKNISEAVKNPNPQPKSGNNGCLSVFIILLKIIVVFFGAIVLLSLVGVAIGLVCALLGVGISSALILPFTNLLLVGAAEKTILFISLILVVLVPIYLLIYFLIKLISGHKRSLPRWGAISLAFLFLLGVFGLFAIAGNVIKDFKTSFHLQEALPLKPLNSDTLVLSTLYTTGANSFATDWADDDFKENIRIQFRESADSLFHAHIEKSARGANKALAEQNANLIRVPFQQSGNILQIPEAFEVAPNQPFRVQRVRITLFIPKGKWVYLKNTDDDWWDDEENYSFGDGAFYYHSESSEEYDDYSYYRMNASGQLVKTGEAPNWR